MGADEPGAYTTARLTLPAGDALRVFYTEPFDQRDGSELHVVSYYILRGRRALLLTCQGVSPEGDDSEAHLQSIAESIEFLPEER